MLNNKAIRNLHIAFLVLFSLLFLNILYISTTGYHLISGSNIKKYEEQRKLKEEKIGAKRGTIYDRNGVPIAKDTYTYTLVAYLNKQRYDELNSKPAYVTNPRKYAKKLAPILGEDESAIYKNLNKNPKKVYQTELGIRGKGLSLTKKEKIEKLKLPGIEFTSVVSRYYPNGVFASSTIGYTTYDEKQGRMVGQLGVESRYDDVLKGKGGIKKSEVDGDGYIRKEIKNVPAVDGSDVYLTINKEIQMIVERNMDDMLKNNPADMALAVVADGKTNEILALSNRPTFNPNKLDIEHYNNPFVSLEFEPGSTMKTFTYAAAMDSKVYRGNKKFNSLPLWIKDNGRNVQSIKNYDGKNWGTITYDEGFMRSSNTGIIHLFENQLSTATFENYLDRFKFYKRTGIEIAGEGTGRKVMGIKQEKYTTGFGQASTITPVQLIQSFSAITNNGKMMKPYITKKIVANNKVTSEFKPTEVGQPISKKTSKKMLKLMTKVVEDPRGTGYDHYRIENYKVAGKTGTAEYVENNKYQSNKYYTSFLMTAPASNPDIIIYIVTKNDKSPMYKERSIFTKNVTSNVLAYLKSKEDKKTQGKNNRSKVYQVESFINKSIDYSLKKLDNSKVSYYVIGDGDVVINQSPVPYMKVSNTQKIFLLTESKYYKMIDLTGFSKADVSKYAALLNLKIKTSGSGYVSSQNIKEGQVLNKKNVIKVNLE